MVTRRISKKRYLIALVLTLLIFFAGLVLGIILTDQRAEFLSERYELQQLDYDSTQLQYLYLKTLSENKNCDSAIEALKQNIYNLEKSRIKLENYIAETFNQENADYQRIKREYTLAEIRYWLLTSEAEKVCEEEFVSILYFYSNQDCLDCQAQGNILTVLKDSFEEKLLIFALDSDFEEEPLISVMKSAYDITETPTLVIQGEKHEGLVSQEDILEQICPSYDSSPEICSNY
ncbi:hypothetical protein K8R47_03220 [archaeon]|nr:hypothetical protein [archaeon]